MREYPIGTRVSWTSHGRYGATKKRGVVVWVIPAGEKPSRAHGSDRFAAGKARKDVSFIVEVTDKAGKKIWYRPKTHKLRQTR